MKDITVFIVEDEALSKELIQKHFEKGKITYAALFKEDQREKITTALDLCN